MERVKASNIGKLKRNQLFLETVLLVMACTTVALQIAVFERTRHLILCGVILALCIVLLILDRILDDKKSVITHTFWTALWTTNFVMNLLVN